MDDVIKLPPLNERIGSCPECGKPIWKSDKTMIHFETLGITYQCIECKIFIEPKDIIPF
jgi:predicted RNA-binding Zn-ribbon protein involved in translation (DUF1610 family)